MLKFNKKYLILTIILFITELLIALFVKDNFIRPYFGDVLVVILIYTFLKTFINSRAWKVALFTLVFAVGVEALQYFRIIEILGLKNNFIARIIIGTSFSWYDILTYIIGIAIVLIVEKLFAKKK